MWKTAFKKFEEIWSALGRPYLKTKGFLDPFLNTLFHLTFWINLINTFFFFIIYANKLITIQSWKCLACVAQIQRRLLCISGRSFYPFSSFHFWLRQKIKWFLTGNFFSFFYFCQWCFGHILLVYTYFLIFRNEMLLFISRNFMLVRFFNLNGLQHDFLAGHGGEVLNAKTNLWFQCLYNVRFYMAEKLKQGTTAISAPWFVGPGVDGSKVKKFISSSRQNWFLFVVTNFDSLVKEIFYFAIINNGLQISVNKVLNCNRNTFPPNIKIFRFIYHQHETNLISCSTVESIEKTDLVGW